MDDIDETNYVEYQVLVCPELQCPLVYVQANAVGPTVHLFRLCVRSTCENIHQTMTSACSLILVQTMPSGKWHPAKFCEEITRTLLQTVRWRETGRLQCPNHSSCDAFLPRHASAHVSCPAVAQRDSDTIFLRMRMRACTLALAHLCNCACTRICTHARDKPHRDQSFPRYLEDVDKASRDCAAAVRRLVLKGPPIWLDDKHGYPIPDGDSHVSAVWYMSRCVGLGFRV